MDAKLLALYQYFIQAGRMHFHLCRKSPAESFISRFKISKIKKDFSLYDKAIYLNVFYALLYVLVEGWQSLKLTDDNIDMLLQSPNVSLLRDFRNGIFHYQHKLYPEKIVDFLDKAKTENWTQELWKAFDRYFSKFALDGLDEIASCFPEKDLIALKKVMLKQS
jgi:hypothetical protein